MGQESEIRWCFLERGTDYQNFLILMDKKFWWKCGAAGRRRHFRAFRWSWKPKPRTECRISVSTWSRLCSRVLCCPGEVEEHPARQFHRGCIDYFSRNLMRHLTIQVTARWICCCGWIRRDPSRMGVYGDNSRVVCKGSRRSVMHGENIRLLKCTTWDPCENLRE